MADISTYRCSNRQCRLTMHLASDFPIWKENTPLGVKTPTPAAETLPYVEQFRTDTLCYNCRKVVTLAASDICSNCSAGNLHTEHVGKTCPLCSTGAFTLTNVVVY